MVGPLEKFVVTRCFGGFNADFIRILMSKLAAGIVLIVGFPDWNILGLKQLHKVPRSVICSFVADVLRMRP